MKTTQSHAESVKLMEPSEYESAPAMLQTSEGVANHHRRMTGMSDHIPNPTIQATEQPPRSGLTRINTGYPADPYIGWFWELDEIPNIERRSRQSHDLPVSLVTLHSGVPVQCKSCGATYYSDTPGQGQRCGKCRQANGAKKPAARKKTPPTPRKPVEIVVTPCAYCGQPFPQKIRSVKYCSAACGTKGRKQRARMQRIAQGVER